MKRILPFVVAMLVAFSGCKPAEDLMKYKDQIVALSTAFGPKIKTLMDGMNALQGKLGALPADFAGVADLKKLVTDKLGSVSALSTLVTSGLSAKFADVVKAGKKEDVVKFIADSKADVEKQFTGLEKDFTGATKAFGEIETAVKAAAGSAAGWMFKLPSGAELKGNNNGVESMLVAFINDAKAPVEKTKWFSFDRVTFKTGSADVDMDKSKDQLTNIVMIMKEYPKVALKVGGYTDNVGDAKANLKLSGERAGAVVAELVKMGADKARLASEGYGQEHPVCAANDTDECKAKNRRIDVNVQAK